MTIAPTAEHYELASRKASLGVGHIWTAQGCPAYLTLNPDDCTCRPTTAQEAPMPMPALPAIDVMRMAFAAGCDPHAGPTDHCAIVADMFRLGDRLRAEQPDDVATPTTWPHPAGATHADVHGTGGYIAIHLPLEAAFIQMQRPGPTHPQHGQVVGVVNRLGNAPLLTGDDIAPSALIQGF